MRIAVNVSAVQMEGMVQSKEKILDGNEMSHLFAGDLANTGFPPQRQIRCAWAEGGILLFR